MTLHYLFNTGLYRSNGKIIPTLATPMTRPLFDTLLRHTPADRLTRDHVGICQEITTVLPACINDIKV